MSYKVSFIKKADLDILKTTYWYNDQQTGLGDKFQKRLFEKIDVIAKNSTIYRIRHNNTRGALLYKFPHVIYYAISDDKIIVLAIQHAKRNPKLWIERKLYE